MPNPEISQYKDHDTNTVYDLKDATARADINNLNTATQRNIIALYFPATGTSSGYTQWGFTSASENYGYFDGHDMQMVRVVFNSNLADFTKPVQFIYYGDYERGVGAYICDVFSDWLMTDSINGIYKNGEILDFIFSRYANCFVLVGKADAADLSNYYTKAQTDTLLNAKVSDNPTFTEAATRQNIASGETFAVILGKIKKFFSDLKAVAFSGSYNDLTDTPTIPAAQVNSDWNANSGVAEILNKPTLATVATSGNYNDLDYKPTFSAGTGINIRGSGSPGYDWDYEIEFTGDADDVDFDNSVSGLSATNVEEAIDELAAEKADASSLAPVATSGQYSDLTGTPTIPAAQVQSDWTQADNTEVDYIKNKPTLAPVATSGDYNDLTNQPTFKTINNVDIVGTGNITTPDTKPSNGTYDSSPAAVPLGTGNNWQCISNTPIFTAQAGQVWLFQIALEYQGNATGLRGIGLSGSSTTAPTVIFKQQIPAVTTSGTVTNLTLCSFVAPSSTTSYYIWGRQNSGSSLNVTYRYRAIRLL